MIRLDRRKFLKTTALTGVGVMSAGNLWALDKLEPVADPLTQNYPYRDWEDLHRKEWTWDHVGHCCPLHQLCR